MCYALGSFIHVLVVSIPQPHPLGRVLPFFVWPASASVPVWRSCGTTPPGLHEACYFPLCIVALQAAQHVCPIFSKTLVTHSGSVEFLQLRCMEARLKNISCFVVEGKNYMECQPIRSKIRLFSFSKNPAASLLWAK